ADVRELKGKATMSSIDLRFFDEAMSAPYATQGPIDELLRRLCKKINTKTL
ncbi:hypothetical protein HAX54_012439, partial [Datura stramonium]|nr:hypothetical protein [Datura stramonium]